MDVSSDDNGAEISGMTVMNGGGGAAAVMTRGKEAILGSATKDRWKHMVKKRWRRDSLVKSVGTICGPTSTAMVDYGGGSG